MIKINKPIRPFEVKNMLPVDCKTLFYPGAYYDFSTLKYFMQNSRIKKYYYCDYYWGGGITNESIIENIQQEFGGDFDMEISVEEILNPTDFNKKSWNEFYHPKSNSEIGWGCDPKGSFATKFIIKWRRQIWQLIYFTTEAIQTYDVLLENGLKIDLVVTQDHGLGGFWTTFCRGSILEKIAKHRGYMPKLLLVGEDQESWQGYNKISEPFGCFGMHKHSRVLYQYENIE